jgi:osmotically-inducible protein OsmY
MAGVAVVTALAVSSAYEPRSLGQRLDDGVGAMSHAVVDWGAQMQAQLQRAADAAVSGSAQAAQAVDTAVDDAAIHARIVTALLADPALQPSRIEVFVDAGHVRLQGAAPSAADKERASSLAQATAGVRGVDNRLSTP